MNRAGVLWIIAETDAAINCAMEYLGTHGASDGEIAVLERARAAQQAGKQEELLTALVEAGALQGCPTGFWHEIQKAAGLILPIIDRPNLSVAERSRREQFHAWIRRRGEVLIE